MVAYALTIFIGAFLLFQVQPLIGKYILPWFGGGPGVWTTCLLFFQVLLLGGYAYAHLSARLLRPRAQALVHLALLGVALTLLPITPADSWKPHGGGNPTLQILILLAATLGLPYLLLSATSPLLQHWFSRSYPAVSPYRLYALSNVGSLLALVSYPFFFETHFTRRAQAGLWGWGLAAFVLGCGLCALHLWRHARNLAPANNTGELDPPTPVPHPSPLAPQPSPLAPRPSPLHRLLWVVWPACASVLLLATTNKLCQDVAVIPFLWVLPLGLYLLSFVICFDSPRWYRRLPFTLALGVAAAAVCWALFQGIDLALYPQVAIYAGALFVCCMVCHGELYRLKPDPRQLTGYYLLIAAGGALGGGFVALAAPLLFTDYYELHLGLLLCGILLTLVTVADRRPRPARWARLGHVAVCLGLPLGVVALGTALRVQARAAGNDAVCKTRNFYGVLTVFEYNRQDPLSHHFLLQHGAIAHGLQFADPERAAWPTTYYNRQSGIGLALDALPAHHLRIGLVGLGTGTLTTYALAGDYVRIYEINPAVQRLATTRFSYLASCSGRVEVVQGDARLSMEHEPPQRFDLLALDAFSGDAVPVHLLTKEAFEIYERHLQTNGIIAVHISNQYLDLEPVVVNLARQFHYQLASITFDENDDEWWNYASTWILLTRDRDLLRRPAIRQATGKPKANQVPIPLWTDDFASLFQILP